MKRILLMALILGANAVNAQLAQDIAIYVKATPQPVQEAILLEWEPKANTSSFTISRKQVGDAGWTEIANLGGTDTTYLDEDVEKGKAYEYLFTRNISNTNYFGTLSSGIELPPVHYRGAVLVVVDSALKTSLNDKINEFFIHLATDGWTVHQLEVGTAYDHFRLKDSIQSWYEGKPTRRQTVLLFGDIPVPYSGYLNPDAHAEHKGAWPADVYYGEFKSDWTDKLDYSFAQRAENKNFIGDGKFDNSKIPGEVKLQIGRVDLHNITSIGWDTDSLYYNYLNKDIAFRTGSWEIPNRFLFADRLKALGGEYPGRTAVVTANALVGADNLNFVTDADFVDSLQAGPYLLSHACGYGSYTGNTQIKTADFKLPAYSVFGAYFGSYHGDWDNKNNLIRSAIAGPGYTLTSMWSGRPQWHLHTMGMGYPIGYSARLTQNNFIDQYHETYDPGAFAGMVHVALHGDPTLRLHPVIPPSKLTATVSGDKKAVDLSWDASADPAVQGYYVYRSDSIHGVFNQLNTQMQTGTTFKDSDPLKGTNVYVVKAAKLETSVSGSYWNLSNGPWKRVDDVDGTAEIVSVHQVKKHALKLYPNPSHNAVTLTTDNVGETLQVHLYSIDGKLSLSNTIASGEQLNISSMSPGVYLVIVQGEDHKVYRKKLIVQ